MENFFGSCFQSEGLGFLIPFFCIFNRILTFSVWGFDQVFKSFWWGFRVFDKFSLGSEGF